MATKQALDLLHMNRADFEALDHGQLVELACRLRSLAVEQAERLAMNSTNSSRPPSSDPPFGPGGGASSKGGKPAIVGPASGAKDEPVVAPTPPPPSSSGRRPGKQPGSKGKGRDEPLTAERAETHWPERCARCGIPFEMWDRTIRIAMAYHVVELERTPGGIRLACVLHRYAVVGCACGHETAAAPGAGALSFQDGRQRQLLLSEHSLIGPDLASFIVALSIRHHQSRARIREFLGTWFGVALSIGTIDRCIREVGVACEPLVEELLEEVRGAGVIHADETPWKQGTLGLWLWVVVTTTTAPSSTSAAAVTRRSRA
jgi:hypothetical protein